MPMKVDDLDKYGNYTELEMKIAKLLKTHKGTAYTCDEVYEELNKGIKPRTWGDVPFYATGLYFYCTIMGNMAREGKIKSRYAGGKVYYYI